MIQMIGTDTHIDPEDGAEVLRIIVRTAAGVQHEARLRSPFREADAVVALRALADRIESPPTLPILAG